MSIQKRQSQSGALLWCYPSLRCRRPCWCLAHSWQLCVLRSAPALTSVHRPLVPSCVPACLPAKRICWCSKKAEVASWGAGVKLLSSKHLYCSTGVCRKELPAALLLLTPSSSFQPLAAACISPLLPLAPLRWAVQYFCSSLNNLLAAVGHHFSLYWWRIS